MREETKEGREAAESPQVHTLVLIVVGNHKGLLLEALLLQELGHAIAVVLRDVRHDRIRRLEVAYGSKQNAQLLNGAANSTGHTAIVPRRLHLCHPLAGITEGV